MKKILVYVAFCTAMAACGSSGNKEAEQKPAENNAAVSNENDKGLEMIGALDCTTCHKINEKNIGPAYIDVSKKYEATEATIDTLAHKVITGGTGKWGSVPMTPHPSLSLDSAKVMVRYILNLKNQK